MMNITSVSELRKNTKKYFDRVADDEEIIIVTRPNGRSVVLMSMDAYNDIDTTDYLSSSVTNRLRLLKSLEQARAGKVIPKTTQELKGD
ncbi:MAG TPA: type II toxin-antitoxin system prevent-host-death family antitoxin [Candidatus Limnocylindria bacterium]|nr:type II toxin-antitoxin system prevent-host-death family antitoxin [Candidatus Limnocylindria bacterium]